MLIIFIITEEGWQKGLLYKPNMFYSSLLNDCYFYKANILYGQSVDIKSRITWNIEVIMATKYLVGTWKLTL